MSFEEPVLLLVVRRCTAIANPEIHSRSAVWIAEFLTRKPQTNILPYLSRLLPLTVGNGDKQVHLRETDEF
jgi:hypothetical protein